MHGRKLGKLEALPTLADIRRPKLVDLVQPPPTRKRRPSLSRRSSPRKRPRENGEASSSKSTPDGSRATPEDVDYGDDDVVELAESGELLDLHWSS